MKSAAIAFALCAGPAIAQDQISPDQFLDLALGRTLSFSSSQGGALIGEEQFLRRDLSVWADSTGRCTYGQIGTRGPFLCFLYEDVPDPENCWIPFLDKGTLLVLSQSTREMQRISDVSSDPIICTDAPTS